MDAAPVITSSPVHPLKRDEDRIDDAKLRRSGFDYMRLFLALAVISWHCEMVCYGDERTGNYWKLFALARMVLPAFFALSGFLVAGSLRRCRSLVSFLGLRGLRLLPALVVETVVSALIIGPLFTAAPLHDYFFNKEFFSYFLNIIGDIHYDLPGIFLSNPSHKVNAQLWTVPAEFGCYIVITCMAVFNLVTSKRRVLFFFVALTLLQIAFQGVRDRAGVADGFSLIMSFVTGVLMYHYYDDIRWSKYICILMLVLAFLLMCTRQGVHIANVPVAYATIYLGMLNPPRNRILLSGDYSYGLYLYGFPVQQMLVAINPLFKVWYLNLLAAIPLTTAVAACSWWCVERPAFRLKPRLMRLEQFYLALTSRLPPPPLRHIGS